MNRQVIFFIAVISCVNGHKKHTKNVPKMANAVTQTTMLNPEGFWIFRDSKHVNTSTQEYALLRNTVFNTNYPGSPDRSLQFSGQVDSYASLPNTKNKLDGRQIGGWFMYVNPDKDETNGTLLEYEASCPSGRGVRLRYVEGYIRIIIYSDDNAVYSGQTPQKINAGQWTYVGVTWHNKESVVYIYLGSTRYIVMFLNLKSGDKIHAYGTVRVGASFNGDAFKGRIGCLWFQNAFFFEPTAIPLYMCDPSLRTSSILSATQDSFTEGSVCFVEEAEQILPEEEIIVTDTCTLYTQENATIGSPLRQMEVTTLHECVRACVHQGSCDSFVSNASSVGNGRCILGRPGSVADYDTSFTFFIANNMTYNMTGN